MQQYYVYPRIRS